MIRRLFGDEIDPALRPLLILQVAGSMAGAALFTYIGIWALRRLEMSGTTLGLAFLCSACGGIVVGFLGGHLSDHVGRRPLMLVGRAIWGCSNLVAIAAGSSEVAGFALIVTTGALGALGDAADSAIVADLVAPERREAGYAALRVAQNVGSVLGPPLGGAFLTAGWNAFFAGCAALAGIAFLLAWRLIPKRGCYAPDGPPERSSWRVIARDGPYLALLAGATLAGIVYVGFEILLPVSLVQNHGLTPAAWGLIVIVNPALVFLLQLRVTRLVSGRRPAPRLIVAMLLMGFPFLLLSVADAVPFVVAMVLVFVIGEMLWIPTMQTAIASRAPADLRGAYMGAYGATFGTAFALAPLIGLQALDRAGDTAMWMLIAAISVAAAGVFAVVLRPAR